MRRNKPCIEIRAQSIRIRFTFQGRQCARRLCVDGNAIKPTPANVKYAYRIAAEIGDKIRLGVFNPDEYFPENNQTKRNKSVENSAGVDKTNTGDSHSAPLLYDLMDKWIAVHDIKASTRKQYKARLNSFWKTQLKNVPVDKIRCSDVLTALANGTWKSAKSRNNELSMIRGVFDLAKNDKFIKENPCDTITHKLFQRKKPDPFSLDEVNSILNHLQLNQHEQIFNFVQFMFFTGLRTSEGLALRWGNIDFRGREMLVEGGNVYDDESETTKTSESRTVLLNKSALEALSRQKAHTFLLGQHVFHDPKTSLPWKYQTITDVRTFWKNTLRQTGIRYRRPYNMRHTYATLGLMSGAKPAFMAHQLGHSLRMFFEVYAKWINSSDDRTELNKMDEAIQQHLLSRCEPVDVENFGHLAS